MLPGHLTPQVAAASAASAPAVPAAGAPVGGMPAHCDDLRAPAHGAAARIPRPHAPRPVPRPAREPHALCRDLHLPPHPERFLLLWLAVGHGRQPRPGEAPLHLAACTVLPPRSPSPPPAPDGRVHHGHAAGGALAAPRAVARHRYRHRCRHRYRQPAAPRRPRQPAAAAARDA
eukprot:scaffold101767_cov60-Phaeocystis_antarctica.AAC.1